MPQDLLFQAKKQILDFKTNIEEAGYSTNLFVQKDYNFEFVVHDPSSKVKVLVYFGKKGLKTILQGDEKSILYNSINSLMFDQQTLNLGHQEIEEPEKYIGSDEAGKGDVFGPLVVAAVYADSKMNVAFKKIGVRDSKDLSDYQIGIIAEKIKSICKNNFAVIVLEPHKYNEVYDRYKNLNSLLSNLHSKAIQKLLDNTDAKLVISDKFGKKGLEIHSNKSYSHIEFIDTEKAERFTAVAAASILARDAFVSWFVNQKEKHNYDLPKGAADSTKVYLEKFINRVGKENINKFVKLHFKTVKSIL